MAPLTHLPLLKRSLTFNWVPATRFPDEAVIVLLRTTQWCFWHFPDTAESGFRPTTPPPPGVSTGRNEARGESRRDRYDAARGMGYGAAARR